MAIYHFSVQNISRGGPRGTRKGGRNAIAAAAYRAGERLPDFQNGKIYDYSRKPGVVHKEVLAPSLAPRWMSNRTALWNAVEQVERRKDARLAKEINLALPAELDLDRQIELLREYIQQQFVETGMVADYAIHIPYSDREGSNPQGDRRNVHAHIMLTTRTVTPQGFGLKNRQWNERERLIQWRSAWADHCNRALESHQIQIDHRSFRAQGLDREPTIHLGPQATALERQGLSTDKGDYNRKVAQINEWRVQCRSNVVDFLQPQEQQQRLAAIPDQELERVIHNLGEYELSHEAIQQPAVKAPPIPIVVLEDWRTDYRAEDMRRLHWLAKAEQGRRQQRQTAISLRRTPSPPAPLTFHSRHYPHAQAKASGQPLPRTVRTEAICRGQQQHRQRERPSLSVPPPAFSVSPQNLAAQLRQLREQRLKVRVLSTLRLLHQTFDPNALVAQEHTWSDDLNQQSGSSLPAEGDRAANPTTLDTARSTHGVQSVSRPRTGYQPDDRAILVPAGDAAGEPGVEPCQFKVGSGQLSRAIARRVEQREFQRFARAVGTLNRSLGEIHSAVEGAAAVYAALRAEAERQNRNVDPTERLQARDREAVLRGLKAGIDLEKIKAVVARQSKLVQHWQRTESPAMATAKTILYIDQLLESMQLPDDHQLYLAYELQVSSESSRPLIQAEMDQAIAKLAVREHSPPIATRILQYSPLALVQGYEYVQRVMQSVQGEGSKWHDSQEIDLEA